MRRKNHSSHTLEPSFPERLTVPSEPKPLHAIACAIAKDAAPTQDVEPKGGVAKEHLAISLERLDHWARSVTLHPQREAICVDLAVLARRAAGEGAMVLMEQLVVIMVVAMGPDAVRQAMMTGKEMPRDVRRAIERASAKTTQNAMAPPQSLGASLRTGSKKP